MNMASMPKNHLFMAFLLIIFGLLLLLNNLGVTSIDLSLGTWWPLLLVIVGLHQLLSSRWTNLFGLVPLLLGGVFLLRRLGLLEAGQTRLVWPLLLILFGFIFLFNLGSGRRREAETAPENTVDMLVIFGGVERRLVSPNFYGGNLTVLFGGATLDLRGSALPEGVNSLNIQVIFGGVDLILPEEWAVEIRGLPIFGGIEDKRAQPKGPETASGPRLRLNTLVFFGGIDIKD